MLRINKNIWKYIKVLYKHKLLFLSTVIISCLNLQLLETTKKILESDYNKKTEKVIQLTLSNGGIEVPCLSLAWRGYFQGKQGDQTPLS